VLGSPGDLFGTRLGAVGKWLGLGFLGNPEKLVVLGHEWEDFGSSFGSQLGHFRKIREFPKKEDFWERPKKVGFGKYLGGVREAPNSLCLGRYLG
jgi:hypothetical protein